MSLLCLAFIASLNGTKHSPRATDCSFERLVLHRIQRCWEVLLLVPDRSVVICVSTRLCLCIHPCYGMGDQEVDESGRPEKRQRLDEQQAAGQQQQQAADADDAAPPAPPPAHDQISAALTKIRHHIGNSSKFSKASQLLRQLLDAVDKVSPDC